VNGREFHLSSGETAVLKSSGAANDSAPYGICFESMSALVNHISGYPVIQGAKVHGFTYDFSLADVFGDRTCVKGYEFFPQLSSPNSSSMKVLSTFTGILNALGDLSLAEAIQGAIGLAETNGTINASSPIAVPNRSASGSGPEDSVDDESTNSLSGSAWYTSSESESGGSRWVIDEFLGDTLPFGSSFEEFDSFTSDTDDGAANPTGGKDNGFLKIVFPDPLWRACYHAPRDLSCHYGNETIQLMYPEAVISTPMPLAAPVAAPSMATAQWLRH
jgi:hypothetical protein